MLYLSANTSNVIYTSVSVHKTLSNPTYLMTLTHQQTGKKWSFIPQNISSISGTPYNQRYDLFKFDISHTDVDLTGGTRTWYYQISDWYKYDDARYVKEQTYVQHWTINDSFGIFGVGKVFDTPNEEITGGTITLNGTELSSINILKVEGEPFDTQTWVIRGAITTADGNFDQSGEMVVTYETNSGNTFNETYYVPSCQTIYDVQPWTLYGYTSVTDILNNKASIPPTYIDTPSVNIDEIGEFRYAIREQINPINLNTQYTTDLLESGLAYVYQAFDDIYYNRGGEDVVYNPDKDVTYHILNEDGSHLLTENNEELTQE
jgi:hypothetical protein